MSKNLVKKANKADLFKFAQAAGISVYDLAKRHDVDPSFFYKVLKGEKKSQRISLVIDQAIRDGKRFLVRHIHRKAA